MHGIPPTSLELVIEASTCVVTMAQKPLATAAVNHKVDMAPDGLNGKKFCELLCCKPVLLFELSPQPQEID